jgi:hypothetical protein
VTFIQVVEQQWGALANHAQKVFKFRVQCISRNNRTHSQNKKDLDHMESLNARLVIPGGNDPLQASDLRQLIDPGGEANDALVNYFVDLCQRQQNALRAFMGLDVPKNRDKTLVVTSFLYLKIRDVIRRFHVSNNVDVLQEQMQHVLNWHSKVSSPLCDSLILRGNPRSTFLHSEKYLYRFMNLPNITGFLPK